MYEAFAGIYDSFMEETPYDQWADFIENLWKQYALEPKLVLDLACGTGAMTTRLHQRGYDMIGIDNSEDMLAMAKEKSSDILFLHQDITNFDLYGTVDAVICLCDSMNYLLSEQALHQCLSLVEQYLNPGGFFIFDMNTIYQYEHILANHCFSQALEDRAYIWDNFYNAETGINEYFLDFFVLTDSGLYRRFEEIHYQRAYDVNVVTGLIEKSGLELKATYDSATFALPQNDTRRIFFVVEKSKSNKTLD